MTGTLSYERINNHRCSSFPLEKLESLYGKSYYKFYQLKLRQVLIETRCRQEQRDGKVLKEKQSKTQLNDKRLSKEYMNHLPEKIKIPSQNDENGKLPITNHRKKESVICTITSTDISTTN